MKTYPSLTAYRVTYRDGSTTSTNMAAGVTPEDAQAYYVGKWFNFGDVDGPDVMKQAVKVEAIRTHTAERQKGRTIP